MSLTMQAQHGPKSLDFSYDSVRDILTVNGVKYSGDLFRHLSLFPPATDRLFRVVKNDRDTVTIETFPVTEEQIASLRK